MTNAEMQAQIADLTWRMTVPPSQLAHTVQTSGCTGPCCAAANRRRP